MRAVVAVVLLGLIARAQGGEVFEFSVPFAKNLDLDATRMAALLASPDTTVTLNYEPELAIPGLTGRWGYCAFTRFHLCVKKNWQPVVLSGTDIHHEADRISVALPTFRWFGLMPYHINRTVRVTLPAMWPGEQGTRIDIPDISLGRQTAPLVDMHLPPPYAGIGAYRLLLAGKPATSVAYTTEPCDAALTIGTDGSPAMYPEHMAALHEDWLKSLTNSPWWASQIPGTSYHELVPEPSGVGGLLPERVEEVYSAIGMHSYRHLRAVLPGLPDVRCPGRTRFEISWMDGHLLAASQVTDPDIDGPAECPLGTLVTEALWWEGQVVAYNGPRMAGGEVTEWARRKLDHPECMGPMIAAQPDVTALTEAAQRWSDYLERAKPIEPGASQGQ